MKKIEIINNKVYCFKCNKYKDLSEYYIFNNIPKRPCKDCKIQYQKIYFQNTYYKDNTIIRKKRFKNPYSSIKEYQKEYRKNNKNILKIKKKNYSKNRIQNNPSLKLRPYVSNAIFQALKFNNSTKNNTCLQYLPYSIKELKQHLESQFESWMCWNNWGNYRANIWNDNDVTTWAWQIDHIIPQSKLPYDSMGHANFKKCWALENLRPYSAKQNVIDGANR